MQFECLILVTSDNWREYQTDRPPPWLGSTGADLDSDSDSELGSGTVQRLGNF